MPSKVTNPYAQYEAGTEHDHWSSYDMSLEGSRFNCLHNLVMSVPFNLDEAQVVLEDLVRLAHSKGWGERDSFVTQFGAEPSDDESDHVKAHRDMYDDDPDSDYSSCLSQSIDIFYANSKTPESNVFISKIDSAMNDARVKGREARDEWASGRTEMQTPKI